MKGAAQSNPCRTAIAAAWRRLAAPSLASRLATWVPAVRGADEQPFGDFCIRQVLGQHVEDRFLTGPVAPDARGVNARLSVHAGSHLRRERNIPLPDTRARRERTDSMRQLVRQDQAWRSSRPRTRTDSYTPTTDPLWPSLPAGSDYHQPQGHSDPLPAPRGTRPGCGFAFWPFSTTVSQPSFLRLLARSARRGIRWCSAVTATNTHTAGLRDQATSEA